MLKYISKLVTKYTTYIQSFLVATAFAGVIGLQFTYKSDYSSNLNKLETKVSTNNDITNKKIIKLALINSYNEQNPCGRPQQLGFIDYVTKHAPNVEFLFENYYMQTKTVNVNITKKLQQAELAKNFVTHEVKADYVITFDDNAFKYVGIPLSSQYKVFFSGLNEDFEVYRHTRGFTYKNIYGVLEQYEIKKIFTFLKRCNIRRVVILTSLFPNETDKGISRFFCENLEKHKVNYSIRYFSSLGELKNYLIKNNKPPIICYFIALTSIYSYNTRGNVDTIAITKTITKYNKKHLEFIINPIYSKLFNISLSEGMSFYKMGEKTGYLFLQVLSGHEPEKRVHKMDSFFACNLERLSELHLEEYYTTSSDLFDKVY